jgi:hypothetical protein
MSVRLLSSIAGIVMLPASVQASACSLALVLALDVSGSVNEVEDRLQREGVAKAMLAPRVKKAFLKRSPVAVFVFEWSMTTYQQPIVPGWQIVNVEEDLSQIASAILTSRRGPLARLNPPTAVGSALGYAAEALRNGPQCDARTIDISGDGENNDGFGPAIAYAAFPLQDVTVNALVIGGAAEGVHPFWDDQRLLDWFEAEVLQGPGAFAVLADGYGDYARAMELKLLKELELQMISSWQTARVVLADEPPIRQGN